MYFRRQFPAVLVFGFLGFMLNACSMETSSAVPPGLAEMQRLKSAGTLRAAGLADMDAGHIDLAVRSFESALRMDEGDDEARLGLAESYLKLGRNDKAYDTFQELILAERHKSAMLQGMGLVELQRGNFEAAEASLRQALEADPSLWRAWNGLGQAYDFQKQWQASDAAYRKALEYTSKPYFIYNNIGVSHMAQKEFKKAAEAFQKSLRYKPDFDIAKTNYKLALAMQDRYDEAVMGDNAQDEARALNNAGYAAMRQGKYKAAERLLIKAIEVSPSFYQAPHHNLQVLAKLRKK